MILRCFNVNPPPKQTTWFMDDPLEENTSYRTSCEKFLASYVTPTRRVATIGCSFSLLQQSFSSLKRDSAELPMFTQV